MTPTTPAPDRVREHERRGLWGVTYAEARTLLRALVVEVLYGDALDAVVVDETGYTAVDVDQLADALEGTHDDGPGVGSRIASALASTASQLESGPEWARAHVMSRRLAPEGIDPDFLREAIWHRSLAAGDPPSDDDVRAYLTRCRERGEPVSGRPEHVAPIRPREVYRSPSGGRATLTHRSRADAGGRAEWLAEDESGRKIASARSRAACRRKVDAGAPGGTWSYTLSTSDRGEVLRRWGL